MGENYNFIPRYAVKQFYRLRVYVNSNFAPLGQVLSIFRVIKLTRQRMRVRMKLNSWN